METLLKNKKVIAFDFFGVICSEVAPIWFQKFFPKEKALKLKEQYLQPADLGKISFDSLLSGLGELVTVPPSKIEADWLTQAKIDDEVVSIVETLQNDFKVVLFSNAVPKFLRQILAKNNLERLFDFIIISSEIGIVKPDPAFFAKALETINNLPKDVLFIDDNSENVRAANKFRIESVVFQDVDTLKQLILK